MNESTLSNASTQSLAGLMGMNGEEPTRWAPAELGAVLRHQLAAPLEFDLRTIAPGGEKTITDLTAAITSGPRPRSFGDLVVHPLPPLDLLRLMKDFSRSGRDTDSLPKEVATVLYYTAISLALLRHSVRITELDNRALVKSIGWCLSQSWVDASVAAVLAEMRDKLSAPPAAT
ncbi:MAG TPA: hypothetical protein VFC46_05745 [Humisphaera sp.]|nr:hypothetical protein [Humisphaera sp.]